MRFMKQQQVAEKSISPKAVAQRGHEEGQSNGHAGSAAEKAFVLDESRQSRSARGNEAEGEEGAHSDRLGAQQVGRHGLLQLDQGRNNAINNAVR